jgi:hypothetical protein
MSADATVAVSHRSMELKNLKTLNLFSKELFIGAPFI